jgi:hypothetical protein
MPDFQRARLIPVSGIDSAKEAETRAASAFLAVLGVVRPLSKTLLDPLGASRAGNATVDTFIEVLFDHEGRRIRPDGVVRVVHGTKTPWTALVEVKTNDNALDADQINQYWDIARAAGYQAVITISNEIPVAPGVHPTPGLKVRANSPVQVHHFSWPQILSAAVTEMVHREVGDVEQRWILGELIRYLKHPASGALQFQDMGPSWVEVRGAARDGTLNRRDAKVAEVARRWDQLLQYAALRLGADIGREVQVVLPTGRKVDPTTRAVELATTLAERGMLDGGLRVPNTAGVLEVSADIKAQQLLAAINIDVPSDRRARARVTWLVSQLGEAPARTIVENWPRNARAAASSASIESVRADRMALLGDGKEPARLRVVLRAPMGVGRKAGTRSPGFVDTVLALVDEFYGCIVQNVTPWQAPAPKRHTPTVGDDEQPSAADTSPGATEQASATLVDDTDSQVQAKPAKSAEEARDEQLEASRPYELDSATQGDTSSDLRKRSGAPATT